MKSTGGFAQRDMSPCNVCKVKKNKIAQNTITSSHNNHFGLLSGHKDIDVNLGITTGSTPLFMAAQYGYSSIVEALLGKSWNAVFKGVMIII